MLTVPMFIIFLVMGWYNIIFAEKVNKIMFAIMWVVLLLYIIVVGVLGGI